MGNPCRRLPAVLLRVALLRVDLLRAVRQCRRHDPRHHRGGPVEPIPGAGREVAGTGMVGAGCGFRVDGGGSSSSGIGTDISLSMIGTVRPVPSALTGPFPSGQDWLKGWTSCFLGRPSLQRLAAMNRSSTTKPNTEITTVSLAESVSTRQGGIHLVGLRPIGQSRFARRSSGRRNGVWKPA